MSNPFNALLSDSTDQISGQSLANSDGQHLEENIDKKLKFDVELTDKELKTNELLVSIFRFVVFNPDTEDNGSNESKVSLKCVSLIEENNCQKSQCLLSFDNLDQFLCERLMVSDVNQCLIDYKLDQNLVNNFFSVTECEQRVLHYLYECYHRIETIETPLLPTQQKIRLRDIVINQSSLLVCHPEVDPNYDFDSHLPNSTKQKTSELLELLESDFEYDFDHKRHLQTFMVRIFDRITAKCQSGDEDITPAMALKPTYEALCQRLYRMSLIDPSLSKTLNTINYLILNANLSKALLALNEPQTGDRLLPLGTNPYQNTLFGLLLGVSCLPRPTNNKIEFFLNPSHYSQQEHDITEKNLGQQLNLLSKGLHTIIYGLLKQHETRSLTLDWIESCLHSFKDRAKMWTNEMLMMAGTTQSSSDGFMINLSSILLRLCKPFCIPVTPKLLKVDARYCRLKTGGHKSYLESICSESFLRPSDSQISDDKFEPNFLTQCFVATQKALHLGFRVVHERFLKLVQDLNQIQNLYREASAQSSDSEAATHLRHRMDKSMTQFLAIKTMLSENEFLEMTLNFHISTAIWLNNLALNTNEIEASKQFRPISLPIPRDFESECLKSVPEFIVENVADFVSYVRRFSDKTFGLPDIDLRPLMSLIIIFMGSPERMKNPHLRAKLAEMLESLMPLQQNQNPSQLFSFSANTEKLFTSHPLSSELIPTVIHVFVSIEISETSGESVAFEQKFFYRRPMYVVLKYLWTNEDHRKRMKELSDLAENNMEASVPPLFLRFINLLMNDAIYLLDEALSYMSKLRELQIQKESGQWDQLPAQQRQQNEANMAHTGRIARFHNMIGRDTINTLSWITEDIKTIFCDKTLVERMAAMLNYFLLHLVGPKKRSFKVKDFHQFEFKPGDIVHDICQIYVNLSTQENKRFKKFCLAVGNDDRSYSPTLLPLASEVLIKTGYMSLSTETLIVGQTVENLLQYQRRHEINLSEVPEEFMDPIMSSIMTDPVILPNSGVRVDRSTIARHLLSDQTDPFTRSPLTMDQVVADTELKQKIKAFIEEKQKSVENKDN